MQLFPRAAPIRPLLRTVYFGFAVTVMLAFAPAALVYAKSSIVIAAGDETRARINATLLGRVLDNAGFRVAYTKLTPAELPSALAEGEVHVAPEVSPERVGQSYRAAIEAGRVIDLGFRQAGQSDPKYKKLVWSGARKRWAGAVKLIKNMTVPEADTQAMIEAVTAGGRTVDQVVSEWLTENRSRWSKWTSASKNWMKP